MPANLTVKDGQELFAANINRGHPWHKLGKKVRADMDIELALELVGVRHETIEPRTMFYWEDGDYAEVEGRIGIYSNVFGMMSTAGPGYEIMGRREILELAFEIVGLGKGEAHIDTIGHIGDKGQVFFSYIRVPDLVIDPGGIADVIERGLFVATSYDGTLPNTIGYSNIRVVCSNTLTMALGNVRQGIRAKHTRNSEARIIQAAEGLGYVGAVEKEVIKRANVMLGVDGDQAIDRIGKALYPTDKSMGKQTYLRRVMARGDMRRLYEGEGNLSAEKVGHNGWAAYNAAVEYLDFERQVRGNGKDPEKIRATAAVLPSRWQDMKIQASKIVMEMA